MVGRINVSDFQNFVLVIQIRLDRITTTTGYHFQPRSKAWEGGWVARPDENFQKSGCYVRTNFQKFVPICSDHSRHSRKKSKFARIAIRPPKKPNLFQPASKNSILSSHQVEQVLRQIQTINKYEKK